MEKLRQWQRLCETLGHRTEEAVLPIDNRILSGGAERLCPDAVFLAPDFTRYRAVSHDVRNIFQRHTDLIEPLSLDEAYLDVSENKTGLPTATLVARTVRGQILRELNLTASAGVAPNKFLAKLASDWRKPDGLFVIQPEEVDAFLIPLPVGRLPGVG
jgi:DNA polymerase-4